MVRPYVLFIVGPTAAGKTSLSLKLAQLLGGEIINADAMQIYRNMDIGTGKPSTEEMLTCPHHLFNILDPTESFSAIEYKTLATKKIQEILKRRKLPIVVGGTGLYINAIVNNLNFQQENNLWQAQNKRFNPIIIGVNYSERKELYKQIDNRVEKMMAAGLLKEVETLFTTGLGKTASQAIGYKEFKDFFNGKASYKETVALIKKRTRNYAKRQLTWFCKLPNVHWISQ
ncbi:MAG: tRNA (adenosine(37)-N6)-dimethylallyltransferase MiaA [Oscillospiraceae bacterium]|jgi:tRNA dimethylallyltransferase|nr:tRNA (adenosine(37)-N6)-dimethylallyltransferase MiaA [Oscillospiraceae bacterium]